MRANTQPFHLDAAQAVDNVRHHFVLFLVDEIVNLRNALEKQSRFASMTKLKGIDREHAKWATDGVFKLCSDMPRLDRAFAAVTRLSRGTLPKQLAPLHEQILRTCEKLQNIRKAIYPPVCKVNQRLSTNLAEVIGPLCDELEGLVIEYYTVAKSLYNLPELDGMRAKK